MKLNEAYSILDLKPGVTPEEAKKQYKKLAKEFHPDVNKEAGADDKFKKINEAYQIISSGKSADSEEINWGRPTANPFGDDPFGMGRRAVHRAENISLNTTISFKDSVLGCKKELKFNRRAKCVDCDGNGKTTIRNGCDVCHGKGKVITRQGNMVMVATCSKCYGVVKTKDCDKCHSKGTLDAEASISVTIPGGIQNGNILRLSGMGNFITSFGPLDQYTDTHLQVNVTPESNLRLHGMDVVSELNISLLDALTGCTKSVNTIFGLQDISIKPKSKNKDEAIIPKLGVNGIGAHKVLLSIEYPDQIDNLISFLSK